MGGTAISSHCWKNRKSLSITCCERATCSNEEEGERGIPALGSHIFPREASYLLYGEQGEDQPGQLGHGASRVQGRLLCNIAEELAHLLQGQSCGIELALLPSHFLPEADRPSCRHARAVALYACGADRQTKRVCCIHCLV